MTESPAYDRETFERAMVALSASAALTACGGEVDFVDLEEMAATEAAVASMAAEGGAFVIPLVAPEGVETGDARSFAEGSLSTRDLPLPLLWQITTADGHNGSVLVGRIDHIERTDNGLGNAYGVFDVGQFGAEAERLVRNKFLRGISADLDKFEATVLPEASAELANDDEDAEKDSGEKIKSEPMLVTSGRVMGITLVPKPAFQECYIAMADEFVPDDAAELLEDGIYEEESNDPEFLMASIVASAAPVKPPKVWFDNPKLSGPTPITVDDDGRVYGHIASWSTAHIGYGNKQVRPPRSRSGYRYFMTGVVRTEEGSDVTVGQLTLAGGHASMTADAAAAVKHYDDTASAVADVFAGEDSYGIWVAGALRPSVSPEQVRTLRASAPSGDWRPIGNALELVAVCQVNVPGFPLARAMVAGGQITALVAAGAHELANLREEPLKILDQRLKAVEDAEIKRMRELAVSRMTPHLKLRTESLTAAAQSARERMKPLMTAQTELAAARDAARERVFALKVAAKRDWQEELHPRDDEGKWKEIIARLGGLFEGVEGAERLTEKLESAAQYDRDGASEAAHDTVREIRGMVAELEEKVTLPETVVRLADAHSLLDEVIEADDVEDADLDSVKVEPEAVELPVQAPVEAPIEAPAVVDPTNPNPDAEAAPQFERPEPTGDPIKDNAIAAILDETLNVDLPPALARLVSWAINQIVAAVDPTQAIRNAPEQLMRQFDGKEFRDVEELSNWIQELIRRQVAPV